MTKQNSRLYRQIPDAPRPLFEANFDGLRYTDDEITNIKIQTGGDSATGIQTNTCELGVTNTVYPSHSGKRITVSLTSAAANWIAARTGATAAVIRRRFTGRTSRITVDDRGTVAQRSSNVQSVHWLALEKSSRYKQNISKGTYINNAVKSLLWRNGRDYTVHSRGTFDNVWETMNGTTWRDSGDKFTGDYGILLAPQRSGDVVIAQLPWRYEQALAAIGNVPTLIRSQVLSPTSWDQPNEANMTKFLVKRYDEDGIYREGIVGTEQAMEGDSVTEELDWSWVKTSDSHWIMAAKSKTYSNGIRTFRLPDVKIDMLRLLRSDRSHDLRQAKHLLGLEVGSVVLMSGDWNNEVNGPQIVTGYNESITADGWEIELSLARMLHVFAEYSPQVPAEVWASANYYWSSETRRWSET